MKKTVFAILMIVGVTGFTSCKSTPKGIEKNETEEVIESEELEDMEADTVSYTDEDNEL